ncbi:uncharacterized protein KY384_003533 [Bacidia gigantensis]|uniref:uncharacterized protein n=1 Tax=Bacidia gigantensis TaxID=2732470 RepID=UPI001D054F43|nr:uncharacterized protein KY384_003533 [Bacidia gigantensis]KAG8531897.1 hypothetical protein KY384_003533 [Bacidia gigantensis]
MRSCPARLPYGAKWEQAIVVAYPKKDGKEAKPPVPAPPEPPKVFVNAPQTAPYELQASFHPPRTPELEAAERPVELEAPQGRPRAISEVSALSDYSQEKEAVPGPRQNHQSYARR